MDRSRQPETTQSEATETSAGTVTDSTADSPTTAAPLFTTVATVAACAGFVLLGALSAYYGPSIPALRSRFGLAPSVAGLALSMYFGGACAGVLVGGTLHRKLRNGRLLLISFLLMAVGSLGFALASTWSLALTASLVLGFGAGGMDYGLNQLFSVGFGRRSPAMLSVLNAFYGVGAVAGPLLISLVGANNYPYAFAGTSVLLVIVACVLRTVRDSRDSEPEHASSFVRTQGNPTRVVIPIIIAFLALYTLQVAVETGVGAWEPTYLQLLGRGADYAANATSVYWLGLTLGRFLVAPLTLRWSEPTIVCVSCLGTTVCLALAAVPSIAPYALVGAGLFNAPVFPAGLPWLNRAAPGVRWAATAAILAANLGGVAAGPLLGLAIEVFGGGSIAWTLTIVSAVCVALAVWLRYATSATKAAARIPVTDP
ncbi:MFS transporter [Actinospica sp. MGRD01-02]|uniref:MFS transporter n=1 Tax=Actinospica acidithermotolerans TaxID=2828514 RepID=A0A941EH95_9ACTN|nr:MFS transporter [Actinospica acidithermotolerans]MBR7827614.1 MFS transporter [Actinospica acidithermotolerans]